MQLLKERKLFLPHCVVGCPFLKAKDSIAKEMQKASSIKPFVLKGATGRQNVNKQMAH